MNWADDSQYYGWTALYPVYVRGEAYLAAHQGSEAAAEFQKILDHRGIVLNEPIGALAHLQIGRAYAMQGDTAKAKAAYQDFLTLWKDADPDIPILIAAKAEYAKLKIVTKQRFWACVEPRAVTRITSTGRVIRLGCSHEARTCGQFSFSPRQDQKP